AVTLPDDLRSSEAGRVLIADADRRLAEVHMGSGFPLRLRWTALFIPAQAAALVLIALFYEPVLPGASATEEEEAAAAERAAELAKNKAAQKPKPAEPLIKDRPGKSDELKDLEADLQRLLDEA